MHFEFDITVSHDNKKYNVVGDAKAYRDYVNADPEGFHGQWEWQLDGMTYSVYDNEDGKNVTDNLALWTKIEDNVVDQVYRLIEERK